MTAAAWIAVAINALMWAFAAGGAWGLLRQIRKDLNGLGAKTNKLEAETNRRFTAIAVLMLAAAGDQDKELLADRLLDKLCR